MTSIETGYAKEFIELGQSLSYKGQYFNMKLYSLIIDDKHVFLDIEIKMKPNEYLWSDMLFLSGYDENGNILSKRMINGWSELTSYDVLDEYEWNSSSYCKQGKNRIVLRSTGPLYDNVKMVAITFRGKSLFGNITINIKNNPEPPKVDEKHIKALIDATDDCISGIYEYTRYDGNYYNYKIYCLPSGNKFEFFNLEDNALNIPGEKIGECFSLKGGNSFKGHWFNQNNLIFLPEENILSLYGKDLFNNNGNILNYGTLYKTYPVKNKQSKISQNDTSNNELLATGSGILISDNIIITNNHVIDGANKIEVVINANGIPETYSAKVLCTDKTNDLAIVCVKDEKFSNVGDAPFSIKSNVADVGTSVFAMGFPMSQYLGDEVKVTDGIISSKSGFDGDLATYQISAAIQPGNSGGPLFDNTGNLIGITSAGLDKRIADNVGYAIKSSYVLNLIDSAPINIRIPNNNNAKAKNLPDLIKALKPFVVLLKIY